MISYAPEYGTVGPHTDGYDVFLLQAMGTRRWQIGDKPLHNAKLIEGLDLQILTEFNPDQQWDLEPGDMLYLPPYFAHHGVAMNDCMTFSVGFRAPSQSELLDSLINTMLENELGKDRYTDPDLVVTQHNAEIGADAVARLKQMLHQSIDEAEPVLASALGKFVTETKSSLANLAAESLTEQITIDEISRQFEQGDSLQRNLYYRFAWSENDANAQLFMAGEAYTVEKSSADNLAILAENIEITSTDWQHLKEDVQSAELLCQLIAEGGWTWQVEPE